jgi:hypothetical protein
MASDRGSEGRWTAECRGAVWGGGGGGGGGGGVKGKERQNEGKRAARFRVGLTGAGVRGEERRNEG